jgi:hypothetical protein
MPEPDKKNEEEERKKTKKEEVRLRWEQQASKGIML